MLHWLKVIPLHFLCTKGSSLVKRPTHLKLPKSFQRLIFLSQPFIFLQRTVLAFLLFMPTQIAQSRKTWLIYSDEDEPGYFGLIPLMHFHLSEIGWKGGNFLHLSNGTAPLPLEWKSDKDILYFIVYITVPCVESGWCTGGGGGLFVMWS